MKKYYKLLFLAIFTFIISTTNTYADEIKKENIERNTYIVGTHMLTNKYPLSTDRIMLAAKSLSSDELNDMIIYFKHPKDGRWINAATGETIDAPTKFEIEFKDFERISEIHTITFNTNGGSEIEEQTVKNNKLLSEPKVPTKKGYIFKEWKLNGNTFDFNTPITENLTLDAVWEGEKYSISYNLDGGTGSNPIGYKGEMSTEFELNHPTKKGYEFLGWTGSNGNIPETEVYIEEGTTGDLQYIAHWEPISYYLFVYFLEEGTSNYRTVYNNWNWCKFGEECRLPESITLEDGRYFPVIPGVSINPNLYTNLWYNVTGFTTNKDDIKTKEFLLGESVILGEDIDIPSENRIIKLYCTYEMDKTTYLISYDLNGGTTANRLKTKYTLDELPLSIENPTREGYNFIGWTLDYYFEDYVKTQGYSTIEEYLEYMEEKGWPIEDYTYKDLVIDKGFIVDNGHEFFLVANWERISD